MCLRSPITQSLSHSVTQSLSHSVTQSLSHSVSQSLSRVIIQSLIHAPCQVHHLQTCCECRSINFHTTTSAVVRLEIMHRRLHDNSFKSNQSFSEWTALDTQKEESCSKSDTKSDTQSDALWGEVVRCTVRWGGCVEIYSVVNTRSGGPPDMKRVFMCTIATWSNLFWGNLIKHTWSSNFTSGIPLHFWLAAWSHHNGCHGDDRIIGQL